MASSNSGKGGFSLASLTTIMQSNNNNNSQPENGSLTSDNVVLSGSLRKLKTMKKKYFVLYRHSINRPARLEYFDSEKKYRHSSHHPKRSINLQTCFNINRKTDTKHKYVIALYTNEDCFGVVCENEQELEQWLHKMLYLQNNKDENGDPPKPTFAHVWSVEVQRRGLAQEKGLVGRYHLCLTDKSITLNRFGNGETRLSSVEFPMSAVRKGGHLNCVFYMELGRQNVLGAGELWVEAQDAQTAQTIHHSIINASSKPSRPRSQSASHATKPIAMVLRRQTQQSEAPDNQTLSNFSPPSGLSALSGITGFPESALRPASPNLSTCSSTASTVVPNNYKRIYVGPESQNSTTGAIVTLEDTKIDHTPAAKDTTSYVGLPIKRDRCDSLPSRNRTISDGNVGSLPSSSSTIMPPPKTIPSWSRPISLCNRPPSSSPISPSICSESEGSSISIDEPDSLPYVGTPDDGLFFHRYAGPQGSAILEESDEYWGNEKVQKRSLVPNRPISSTSLSLPINTGAPKIGSGVRSCDTILGNQIPSSPAEMQSVYMEMYSPSESSPANGSYMPMSPSEVPRSMYTGSSSVHSHSRASSLTEEHLGSQYVDMDMSHNHSHGPKRGTHREGGAMSSAASSSSITSGTPSTDTRFADYPLEKVYSTFGPDDDENNPLSERPLRAYSVGSRLEHSKRKFRMDHSLSSSLASNCSINSRTRAYSVGSRAKMPRSDQYKSSFAGSPAQIALFNSVQQSQGTVSGMTLVTQSDPNNNKTSKKSSSVPILDNFGPSESSESIQEPGTDFMELDFSSISMGMPISETDDYVLSDNLTPVSQSTDHDYLNMEPRSTSKAFPKHNQTEGYVEMRPVGSSFDSTSMSNSPIKHGGKLSSASKDNPLEGDYLNMGGKDVGAPSSNRGGHSVNDDYLNMAVSDLPSSTILLQNHDSSGGATTNGFLTPFANNADRPSSVEEGYLEMSFRANASNSQSAVEFNEKQDNFIQGRKLTTNRSLPINIKYCTLQGSNTTAPTRTNFGLLSKLSSLEEAQSPSQLPIGTKAMNSTAAGTIFPFSPVESRPKLQKQSSLSTTNNVGGAIGIGEMVIARKCLVDGSTGTIKLSEEDISRPNRSFSVDDSSDYVNYLPPPIECPRSEIRTVGSAEVESQGDYVLMNPSSKLGSDLSTKSTYSSFRPIQSRQLSLNTVSETSPQRADGLYELIRNTSGDGSSDNLRGLANIKLNSRPSSVNSDKITSRISNLSLNRPNSANSDRLSTISSSSSSTSTLCGGNSSSSSSTTLCGAVVKSLSPMSISRVASDPSTTADKELHYASLDLPPSSLSATSLATVAPLAKQEADFSCSTVNVKRVINSATTSSSSSATTTPSPNVLNNSVNASPVPAFNYAQLDFAKCELLKPKSQQSEKAE